MRIFYFQYGFKIQHLISKRAINSEQISYSSPHYPSKEKDKDYLEGEVSVSLDKNSHNISELIKLGIETSFSLTNYVYHPVKIHKIKPQNENELPLIEARMKGHTTFPLDCPDEIPLIWRKYFSLLLQDNHKLHHGINWFMRSTKSNDTIDKFIYSWITLNCLYGFLSNADGHKNGIRYLLYNNIPSMEIQHKIVLRNRTIFEYLSSLGLTDKRNNINWSDKLKSSLIANNTKEIIENGISTIAIVRHTIFHGNIDDRQIEAKRCIWPLTHINAEIIKNRLLAL